MPYRRYNANQNSLRHYRQARKLTQYQLAQLIGLQSPSQLGDWERGRRAPSLENLLKVAIVLNVPPTSLYFDLFKQLERDIIHRKEILNPKAT